jgi:hypothetical protein
MAQVQATTMLANALSAMQLTIVILSVRSLLLIFALQATFVLRVRIDQVLMWRFTTQEQTLKASVQ